MSENEDKVTTLDGKSITRTDIIEKNIQYYKEAYEKELTDVCDFSEGSEIRTLHESLSIDVINMYRELHRIQKMKFINYSAGAYLDELACEQHLSRHPSSTAHGQVTFTIPEIISSDLVIPQGTVILQQKTGYEYILQENCIIPQGSLSTTGEVYSKLAGARYNSVKGTLTAFQDIESIRTIISVTNPEEITGGVDPESDEEFRERIRSVKQERAYGTISVYTNIIKAAVNDVHDVQFVDPNILLTSELYPQHYKPGTDLSDTSTLTNNDKCTDCTKVIFVNSNSKPCPTSVLDEVEYVMSQQNNLVVGHEFHIEKALPTYLYFSIHIYYDYPVDEEIIANHIEAFLNGDEITTKKGETRYTGLNIKETLYKSQLIDVIEDVPGVHHVESIHRLNYNPDIANVPSGDWIQNDDFWTYVDENGYWYSKSGNDSVDLWGEKNFDSISLRSGRVFALGSMKSVDSTSSAILEFSQTPAK